MFVCVCVCVCVCVRVCCSTHDVHMMYCSLTVSISVSLFVCECKLSTCLTFCALSVMQLYMCGHGASSLYVQTATVTHITDTVA